MLESLKNEGSEGMFIVCLLKLLFFELEELEVFVSVYKYVFLKR